ncbi:Piso0_005844 [Millerozyma farinosa CBS 7064]|uniref:Piso0_005844 protein n=1 Tax=Pichia sorbitophila (strain ATCC MYA-4447 / BCRC 22081 / CBS 7064 / NBRC 10061 / NRRL Y-12695) TaxID=559304 RepID=G8Y327_PICSO|nr:Piso0_005844 [Millerozyma farinosa CBS 7064]
MKLVVRNCGLNRIIRSSLRQGFCNGTKSYGALNLYNTKRYGSNWTKKWRNKKDVSIANSSVPKNYVIEDPANGQAEDIDDECISAMKHYLKTSEVPPKLRLKLLGGKFQEYIHKEDGRSTNTKTLGVLNNVFWELYKSNNNSVVDEDSKKVMGDLEIDDIVILFMKSSASFIKKQESVVNLPAYVAVLATHITKNHAIYPPDILAEVVLLAYSVNNIRLDYALMSLIENDEKALSSEVLTFLFKRLDEQKLLTLKDFESVTNISNVLLTSEFYDVYISYLDQLFSEIPEVHEYENEDKNITKIQHMTSSIIEKTDLNIIELNMRFKLIKLCHELLSVYHCDLLKTDIKKILDSFTNNTEKDVDPDVLSNIESYHREDEEFIDVLFSSLWETGTTKSVFIRQLNQLILNNDEFSVPLKFQARFYNHLILQGEKYTEKDLGDKIIKGLETDFEEWRRNEEVESELEDMAKEIEMRLNNILLYTNSGQPSGPCLRLVRQYFTKNFSFKTNAELYKYRIDSAVSRKNLPQAIEAFEESTEDLVEWNCATNLSLRRTLNDLIVLLCEKTEDISAIFPTFLQIKQQLGLQCDINAVTALAIRMLEAEYVGDLIEMLKRELPNIKKDDIKKLPTTGIIGEKCRKLFDILHDFVITYENEKTFETNWVLYGELHKYFLIPYESYLPAMKFFCKHKRLNAALIIFRQIKMLSELHGQHGNLPPSREMYLFLFQEFGNQLYQDGVEELHEYLKTDTNINSRDILLANCILNAYSNLQEVTKARDLFIAMSSLPKEEGGINEETIQIMIKTYTYSDLLYVRKFWDNLSTYGIVPNYDIYKQYLIAHVYHGFMSSAIELTGNMEDYNLKLSSDTILAMNNYCLETSGQDELEKWAKENHGEIWDEVTSSGKLRRADNYVPENNLIASPIEK